MPEVESLASFIGAWKKNGVEKTRLSSILRELELERNCTRKSMSTEIFHQRQQAYKLRKEVSAMKKNTQNIQKQLTVIRMFDKKTKTSKARPADNLLRKSKSEPDDPAENEEDKHHTEVNKYLKSLGKCFEAPKLPKIKEGPLTAPRSTKPQASDVSSKDASKRKVKFVDAVQKVIDEKRGMKQQERKKTKLELLVERLMLKMKISQNGNTLKPFMEIDSREGEYQPSRIILLQEYWVGDPHAIGSVRRARRTPTAMNKMEKHNMELRKMLKEVSGKQQSCSRDCNHPGAGIEDPMQQLNLQKHLLQKIRPTASKSHDSFLCRNSSRDTVVSEVKSKHRGIKRTSHILANEVYQAIHRPLFQSISDVYLDQNRSTRVQTGYFINALPRPTLKPKQKSTGSERPSFFKLPPIG